MVHWDNGKWQGETEVACVPVPTQNPHGLLKKGEVVLNSNTSVPLCIIKNENQAPKLQAFILTYSTNSRLLMPRTLWNMCTDYLLKGLF